jgi:nucleoside-diphosphate-sugar epimerase
MILLTGASGFIGGYVIDELVKQHGKENVVALTSKPTDKYSYLLHNNYNFERDYFSRNGLDKVSTIIHAGSFTPKNYNESNDIIRSNSNIINTFKLLGTEFPKLKHVVFLSTLDVYGFDKPLTELSPIKPVSLYAYSKLYCENMITLWAKNKKVRVTILRLGHVYGPGEEVYQKLMPTVIKQVLNGETVKMYGTGEDIRTFIYISDVAESIVNAINVDSDIETINLVGDEEIRIKDLIQLIMEISGKKVEVETVKSNIAPRNLIFDNSKLKALLHNPRVSLIEGLKKEIEHISKL